jgi:hypothetical protein
MKLLKEKMPLWLCLFAFLSAPVMAGTWSLPPVNVGPGNTYPIPQSETQQVAVDPNGNAVAVWIEGVATSETGSTVPNTTVMAATLKSGTKTWSVPVPIQGNTIATGSLHPSVAVDGNGNAIAVWSLYDFTLLTPAWNVYYATYDFHSGTWSGAVLLDSTAAPLSTDLENYPFVVANNRGQAVVAWQQSSLSGSDTIYAAVFGAPFTSSVPTSTQIDSVTFPGGHVSQLASVSMDDAGNSLVVYQIPAGGGGLDFEVASTFFDGTSWITPTSSFPVSQSSADPIVSMDGDGQGVVVFQNQDGEGNYQTYASTFQSGSWSAPIPISAFSAFETVPSVSMNSKGLAAAVWALTNSGGQTVVQAANFSFSTGWTAVSTLSQPGSLISLPQVAIDGNGNAAAVWNQVLGGGSYQVQASVFRHGHWQAPQKATSLSATSSIYPYASVGTNAAGNTVAIWDANGTVQSAVYELELNPPGNFKGKRIENNFLFQSTCSDTLTWNLLPNRSGVVAKYLIYSGNQLIATLSGNANCFKTAVPNCSRGITYEIIAVSPSGAASSPSAFRVTP